MMFWDRLRYEIRLLGRFTLVVPVLILVVGLLLAVVLHLTHTKTTSLFNACLEMFLPLAAGIFVASVCGHDPAIELQLTLPTLYRWTLFYRLALIGIVTALVAIVASLILQKVGLEKELPISGPAVVQWAGRQLIWIAPLLWFLASGLFFALLFRSRTVSIALLGGIWVAENIMYGILIDMAWLQPIYIFATTLTPVRALASFWFANRIELIVTALVLFGISWVQLQQTENLLQKAQGDE